METKTLSGLVGLFLLLPIPAMAGESPNFSIGIGGGAYRPREYTVNTGIRDHFGTSGTPLFRLEAGWVIHRLVSLEASAGYMQKEKTYAAETSFQGETFTASGEYTMNAIPFDLSLVFSADFMDGQVVIPYVGVGMDELYYSQEGRTRVWGWKWGEHALGGFRIFMNPLDPRHTGNLKTDYGIDGVYLDLQAKYALLYRRHNGESTGFDYSGWQFSASFLFEF